jgi:galactokinase
LASGLLGLGNNHQDKLGDLRPMTITEALAFLDTPETKGLFAGLYGSGDRVFADQKKRYAELLERFRARFGDRDVRVFSSPGRSEIGGNHTDHNNGKVLAASVNLDVLAAAACTSDNKIHLQSAGRTRNEVDLSNLAALDVEKGHSNAMIRGICAGFVRRGFRVGGFCAATVSDVLSGSGLSSSAAFEVLVCTILNHFYNEGAISPIILAQIAQFAENSYVGKPSGLMDQAACAVGGLVQMDFAAPEAPLVRPVAYDFAASGHALCIVDTGGNHADLTEDYAAVRWEMEAVAAALGQRVLRETNRNALLRQLAEVRNRAGDRAVLRALHFFAENERVDAQVAALERGDFPLFLALVRKSGHSSFMYNQNVFTPKQAGQSVALGLALSESILGARGAWRVHGGGFAGTIQAFVPTEMLAEYREIMENTFGCGNCYALHVRPFGGIKVI